MQFKNLRLRRNLFPVTQKPTFPRNAASQALSLIPKLTFVAQWFIIRSVFI